MLEGTGDRERLAVEGAQGAVEAAAVECGGEAQGPVDVVFGGQPREGGEKVGLLRVDGVVNGFEWHLAAGGFRESEVVVRVTSARVGHPSLRQQEQFAGELPDRLEHPVAHGAVVVLGEEERLVDQCVERVPGLVTDDGLGRGHVERRDEDREPCERVALVGFEEVGAPCERAA